MTLLVEDGTGVAGANSYNSVEEIGTYAADRGLAFPTSPSADAEAAAIRAAIWLDGTYVHQYPGTKTNGRDQGLQWPRTDAEDMSGDEIDEDEVPVEIKSAHAEAAIRELASPGSLNPDYVASTQVAREKVGPLETEYREAYGADSVRPCVQVVDDILAPLLGGRRVMLYGSTARR